MDIHHATSPYLFSHPSSPDNSQEGAQDLITVGRLSELRDRANDLKVISMVIILVVNGDGLQYGNSNG